MVISHNKRKVFGAKIVVVSLIALLFLLSSCSSTPSNAGAVVELNYPSFYAGPRIVSVDIMPRSTITENGQVFVTVEVENQGSSEMRDATLRVFGYDKRYVEMDDPSVNSFSIPAYDQDSPIILSEQIDIDGYANTLSSEQASQSISLFFETDFDYSTILEQEICINPSDYDIYGGCENPDMDSDIKANPQYAPVAVTSFVQSVFGRESIVYFTFDIENKGEGVVDTISLVDARLTTDDLSSCVFIGEGDSHKGSSIPRYTFSEDEEFVQLECEYRFVGIDSAVTKSLYLEFVYDYRVRTQEGFTIVRNRR